MANEFGKAFDQKFQNAILSEIELLNGRQTQLVAVFNSLDVNFDVLNAGISRVLNNCENVKRYRNTVFNLHKGVADKFAEYKETTKGI